MVVKRDVVVRERGWRWGGIVFFWGGGLLGVVAWGHCWVVERSTDFVCGEKMRYGECGWCVLGSNEWGVWVWWTFLVE